MGSPPGVRVDVFGFAWLAGEGVSVALWLFGSVEGSWLTPFEQPLNKSNATHVSMHESMRVLLIVIINSPRHWSFEI